MTQPDWDVVRVTGLVISPSEVSHFVSRSDWSCFNGPAGAGFPKQAELLTIDCIPVFDSGRSRLNLDVG